MGSRPATTTVLATRLVDLAVPLAVHFLCGVVFCLGGSAGQQDADAYGKFDQRLRYPRNPFVDQSPEGTSLASGGVLGHRLRGNVQSDAGRYDTRLQRQARGLWSNDASNNAGSVLSPPYPGQHPRVSELPPDGYPSPEQAGALRWGTPPTRAPEKRHHPGEGDSKVETRPQARIRPFDKGAKPAEKQRGRSRKKRTKAPEDTHTTTLSTSFEAPLLRAALPPVQGVKRTTAGLLASCLTGGAFPAVALAVWGFLEVVTSVSARATIRSMDPTFNISLKNWSKREEAARKAKAEEKKVATRRARYLLKPGDSMSTPKSWLSDITTRAGTQPIDPSLYRLEGAHGARDST